METVKLIRNTYNPIKGTFGYLCYAGYEWPTVERPWRHNQPNVSCIPEGEYICKRGVYHRGSYEAFELQNVPDRSLIKIHKGNTLHDVRGCIALGTDFGVIGDQWAVLNSKIAYNEWMLELDGLDEFQLIISQYKAER